MNVFMNRIKEPSTWAGLAMLAAMFGNHVAPDVIVNGGMAIGALLAAVLPEQK